MMLPSFLLLVGAMLGGLGAVPGVLVVSLATAGLSIASLPKYVRLLPLADEVHVRRKVWQTIAASVVNGLIASFLAYGVGITLRYLTT